VALFDVLDGVDAAKFVVFVVGGLGYFPPMVAILLKLESDDSPLELSFQIGEFEVGGEPGAVGSEKF
jgi:hypothetical protein